MEKIKKGNWKGEEDLKVVELFYLGYTAREIGAEIDRSKEAVQKRIQLLTRKGVIDKSKINKLILENRDSLRLWETYPERVKREINRALNHESNKYITGSSLGKQCKSAYENYGGGKRLKKETEDMVYPSDMPKYIKTIV
ncbi:hypothetical protein QTH09_07585 [Clostridium perfringens]|uniref:Uncharacterized protein n=1 Tax=Clostridium perfringens D str. JGS1721 TaxID=488537 RepID=B1V0K9_CLOPF|nr:hypothetical protein [Clostridium perfringens]EDT70011.1 conserved hypothetical protein [Clostridium perfringens D str. JGS1721]EDT71251.1 conserved hypothetical protein [Clostridium perfringens D str. JGS1721]EDT72379.1 conserved hypothetical protein [Clostridium perfringens D str. JGS1721]EDT72586.1 conserved hypothetical protein [Clostridium perfringens D str. JGS1721]MDM0610894.1 hypothetical protein [Clostridium perfringens]